MADSRLRSPTTAPAHEQCGIVTVRRPTLFMDHLPHDSKLFNEYHALIVQHCKQHCRKKPSCAGCPLAGHCLFST